MGQARSPTSKQLKRLDLPEGVKTIEMYAFGFVNLQCAFAPKLVLPASLANLGKGVFQQAKVDSIIFLGPSKLEFIPDVAFFFSKVRVLRLPASVTKMAGYSMTLCKDLEELWIPITLAHKDVLNPYHDGQPTIATQSCVALPSSPRRGPPAPRSGPAPLRG